MNTIEQKIDLYNYRNGYILYNKYINYEEIDIYKFFDLIFSRNDELPFEEYHKYENEFQNHKYNALLTDIHNKKSSSFVLFKELNFLEEIKEKKFVVTSPITYVGRNRTANNSRFLYAFAIDLDGVGKQEIDGLFLSFHKKYIPCPNIIVSSGNGVHLYYILNNPIALFDNIKIILKRFKKGLTYLVWNAKTSQILERQQQGIFQGFRVPGTQTKFGKIVRAFYLPEQKFWGVRELNKWVDGEEELTDLEIKTIEKANYVSKRLSLKEAREKYPDWYERRIVRGDKSRGKWKVKRSLYDWWKRTITNNKDVIEGHRYFCIMTLAMYGVKCDIPFEEVKEDAKSFLEEMEKKTKNEDNHFTMEDIEDALKVYKDSYVTFPRKDIENITGIIIPANKRNYQKQKDHLEEIRMIRDLRMKRQGKKWTDNNGRKSKKDEVIKYLLLNPKATQYECIKETGMSKNTVKKYWDEAQVFIRMKSIDFSFISFKEKKRICHYIKDRYTFWEELSEEEKKERREKDFIHELQKCLGKNDYERAEKVYELRKEKKRIFKLKNLIIKQGKKEIEEKKHKTFIKKIKQAQTEIGLQKICEAYNLLPNLELF